jgi:hypothetical protein
LDDLSDLSIVDNGGCDEWFLVTMKCDLGSSDLNTSLDELVGQECLDSDIIVLLPLDMSKICELVR